MTTPLARVFWLFPFVALSCSAGPEHGGGFGGQSGTTVASGGGGPGGTSNPGGTSAAGGDTFLSIGGTSGTPDAGDSCGSVTIDTSVEQVIVPGNVLVIFDQSQSMNTADFNGKVRWLAASDAVVAALAPNLDALKIGAVFFPTTNALFSCDQSVVAAIDDTTARFPQIPFMPGAQFIDAWVKHWQSNPLQAGTPIDVGLIRGDDALTRTAPPGKTVVLFVTDGEPTCTVGTTSADLPAKWLAQGIETYVVGLPGAGTQVLQTIATAGGTGKYLLPTDSAQLQQQIASITSKIVKRTFNNCSIAFKEKPADLSKVVLVVTDAATGARYAVNTGPDGWQLEPDGSKATLQGATCNDAIAGRFSQIAFAFGCVHLQILR
jgi:hypothetical protein